MLKDSAMGHPLTWTPTVGNNRSEDVEQFDATLLYLLYLST
jgi:hypothetical protein